MTTVAQLTIEMAANVARLQKDMARVNSTVDGAMAKVRKSAELAAKAIGAIGGAIAVGALTGLVTNLGRTADELVRFSRLTNTTTTQFQELAFGAKRFGVEQDKLADILKDTQDKVGDFIQTGGGAMADFFEQIGPKVGVTAEQFRNLNGADALQLYISSLEKANLSQADMVFYMEAIASDSTLLLPLFAENGMALEEMAKQARALGLVLSEETIAQAQQFDRTLGLLSDGLRGVGQTAAAELLPTLNNLTGAFLKSFMEGDRLKGLSSALAGAMKIIASAIIVVVDAVRLVARSWSGFADIIVAIAQGRFSEVGALIDDLIVGNLDVMKESIASVKTVWDESSGGAVAAIATVNSATGGLVTTTKDAEKANKAAAKVTKELIDRMKEMAKATEEVRKEREAAVSVEAKTAEEIQKQVQAVRDQISVFGKSKAEIFAATQANHDFNLSVIEMNQNLLAMSGGNEAAIAELEKQAQATRDLKAAQADLYKLEGAAEAKSAIDARIVAQTQANERIVENFASLFEDVATKSGKAFADDLKRAINVQFQSFVVRVGVEAALSTGVGSAISGFGTQGGGLSGIFQSAGAFANLGAASNTMANAAVFASAKLAEFAGLSTAATGSLTSFAASAGAAVPYIGAAVAALGVINSLRSNKISTSSLGENFNSDLRSTLEGTFLSVVQSLGGEIEKEFSFLTGGNTGRQGENPNFSFEALSEGVAQYKVFESQLSDTNIQLESLRATFALLKTQDFADNIDAVVQGVDFAGASFEELSAVLQNAQLLAGVNNLTEAAGAMATLSGASLETVQSLLALTGGLEGLQAGNAAFYDAFTTDAQKTQDLTNLVTEAFAQFNQEVPTTRDGLVALRDGLDLQDESQQALFATINELTPALDQLLPAFDSAAQAAETVADAYSRLTVAAQRTGEEIARQRIALEQELFNLTASSEEKLKAQRDAIDESNLAIFDQIEAVKAQRAAQEEAARFAEQAAQAAQQAEQERQRAIQQAQSALESARSNLVAAYERERQALELVVNGVTQLESALRQAFDFEARGLQQTIGNLNAFQNAVKEAFDFEVGGLNEIVDQVSSAESALRSAFDAQSSEIKASISDLNDFKNSIVELRRELVDTAFGVTEQSSLQSLQSVLERVRAGDRTAFGEVSNVAKNAVDAARENSGSFVEFVRKFASINAQLEEANGLADSQLSDAERQLAELKTQVQSLILIDESIADVQAEVQKLLSAKEAAKQAQAQIDKLTEQVDALGLLNASQQTTTQAIAQLETAQQSADSAQAQLEALTAQVSALISIDAEQKTVSQAIADLLAGRAEATAAELKIQDLNQSQISVLGSINQSVLSVADALASYQQAQQAIAQAQMTSIQSLAQAQSAAAQSASRVGFDPESKVIPGTDISRLPDSQVPNFDASKSANRSNVSLTQDEISRIRSLGLDPSTVAGDLQRAVNADSSIGFQFRTSGSIDSYLNQFTGTSSGGATILDWLGYNPNDFSPAQIALATQLSNNQSLSGVTYTKDNASAFLNEAELMRVLNLPGFANGGMFGGGLRIVGENGPELEATGPSRIISNSRLQAMMQGGSNNSEMVTELRALRQEVAQLRQENSAENRSIASATSKTAQVLVKVSENGDSFKTEVMA